MTFPSIRIEGAILSPDILDRLDDNAAGQRPTDFDLPSGASLKDEITRVWADAQDYWRIYQRKLAAIPADSTSLATTETRNNWIVPLLGLLGYQLERQPAGPEINGKIYPFSHIATNRANTPVHIIGARDPAGLDRRATRSGGPRMSAHAMVQEYLNLTDHLYAIVTDGHTLRLLRNSSRLVKLSYLEFDIDRIFTDGLTPDFRLLYRILHASRLPAHAEESADSLIERYHQDSLESGARIRDGLSAAVKTAILDFGNGLLAHPANTALREAVQNGTLTPAAFYQNLLRLIYRILFLIVIEERNLVYPLSPSNEKRNLYYRYYSLQRLRRLSEKRHLADRRHHDIWLALIACFRLFESDGPGPALGISPLAGDLFRTDAIGLIRNSLLDNATTLGCLRSLSLYQNPDTNQTLRVNYAALNVEEFGSVYEGLLEYDPVFETTGPHPAFRFAQGDERAATGSHYTPDDLVQPLLKHSLDHLIAQKLKEPDKEAALLSLRVADIACGSGHILLAAARRIATALSIVRTGEEQPAPSTFRAAVRDVIRHCIYGVDLNPLAVELCKVALWLEAHNPGQPLNFLDHHIKCGNAIVGFVRREEIERGVPDEAFAATPADDKTVAATLRKRNKQERTGQNQQLLPLAPELQQKLDAILARSREIAAMPERNPADIEQKRQRYQDFRAGKNTWLLEQIAAIPIAQFYIPKTLDNRPTLILDEEFRAFRQGRTPQGQATAAAWDTGINKRFFHWFLHFPEIIDRGGFDCILGNPPYLGGTHLSGTYGYPFCNYVKWEYAPTGLSDLVVYFVRRIFSLLRPDGSMGFITTNSIKDGDIRKDGLEQLLSSGGFINFAVRGVKWPGRANLVVSLVSICKGKWNEVCILDNKPVSFISPFFEESDDTGTANILFENAGAIFEGYKPLGDGFFITEQERIDFLREDARNAEVLRAFINGKEINNLPDQKAEKIIIYFRAWPQERARTYVAPFRKVESTMPDERASQNRESNRDRWWIYGEARPALSEKLEVLNRCFVIVRHTKHLAFSASPTNVVLSEALKIFTTDRWDLYTVVQSTLHEIWARKYSGALKQDLRYSPSNCFETFPFPAGQWQTPNATLADIGERYHEHRRTLMRSLWLGLTDIYNLFHTRDLTPAEVARVSKKSAAESETGYQGILKLRALHREMDEAVLAAYGWAGQVALGHDFHEVETLPENDRTRLTISPEARKELLRRLLALNHARHAEEQQQAAAIPIVKPARKKRTPKPATTDAAIPAELNLGLDIFDQPVTPTEPQAAAPAQEPQQPHYQDRTFALPTETRHGTLAADLYTRYWIHSALHLEPAGMSADQLIDSFRLLLTKDSRKAVSTAGDKDGAKWLKAFDQTGLDLTTMLASLLNRIRDGEIEVSKTEGAAWLTASPTWKQSSTEWIRADAEIALRAMLDIQLKSDIVPFIPTDTAAQNCITEILNSIA